MKRDLLLTAVVAAIVGAVVASAVPARSSVAQLPEFEVDDLIVNGTITGAAFSNEIRVFTGSCPSDWTEVTGARGRFLMGIPSGGTLENTLGTAYASTETTARLGGSASGLTFNAGTLPRLSFSPGSPPSISGNATNLVRYNRRTNVSRERVPSSPNDVYVIEASTDVQPSLTDLTISQGTAPSANWDDGSLPSASYANQAAPAPSYGVRFCTPS